MDSFQPHLSSTPVSNSRAQLLAEESRPEQAELCPDPMQIDAIAETLVTIEVQWRSKTMRKILRDDLSFLGKMLCRGTYKQIARAAWRNDKIREHLILLVLHEIDKECSGMCSTRNPSILHKTNKEEIIKFSHVSLEKELSIRAPFFRSILLAASVRRYKEKQSDSFWVPVVCMAAAICLKNRSACMTVIQLMNTIYSTSGLMVSIEVMNSYVI